MEAALNYNEGFNGLKGKIFTTDMMPPIVDQDGKSLASQGLTANRGRALSNRERKAMAAANARRGGPTDAWWTSGVSNDPRDSTIPADYRSRRAPLNRKESRQINAAIEQTKKAVEGLGYSLRILDRANADDAAEIAGMEAKGSLAHFNNAQARIFIAPSFFDAVTGPDMARRYLREELIHAAQLKVAENEHRADPKRNEDRRTVLKRRLEGIFS